MTAGTRGAAGRLPRAVRDVMITRPKTGSVATTVAQAWEMFRDDHVHALLLVRSGRLVTVIERDDLAGRPPETPAVLLGRLDGRVVSPDADLDAAVELMAGRYARRLAVVDRRQRLLGLLCLNRSLRGFCSDDDVRARAGEQLRTAGDEGR